jgi:hypothetical protein
MQYTWADALKDFLGAIGPLFIAVPWFYDFFARLRERRLGSVLVRGPLATLKTELQTSLKETIANPKARDFVWTIVGLLAIAASFLIAFFRGLPELTFP